jgi:hypothetical protein
LARDGRKQKEKRRRNIHQHIEKYQNGLKFLWKNLGGAGGGPCATGASPFEMPLEKGKGLAASA